MQTSGRDIPADPEFDGVWGIIFCPQSTIQFSKNKAIQAASTPWHRVRREAHAGPRIRFAVASRNNPAAGRAVVARQPGQQEYLRKLAERDRR
jgi:hypothetical protein